ncbi:MAG: DUF3772 domain-containing protein [Burkholderiaceae bacterium]
MKTVLWRQCVALVLLVLALGLSGVSGLAQAGEAPADQEKSLQTARKDLDRVQAALADEKINPATLGGLRSKALQVQSIADAAADALTPQLDSVQARLTELGEVAEGATEAPDVAAQRAQLEKNRTSLDAQVKLARLMSVEAGQAVDSVSAQRRSQFQAQLGERTSSILGTAYWSEFRGDLPRDTQRLTQLGGELVDALASTSWAVWLGMALAVCALIALHLWASHRLLKITATRVPSGRLRRSVHAITIVILGLAVPGLMAEAIYTGLTWSGEVSEELRSVLRSTVAMVCFAGYVAGLGGALISPYRTSWRLPPIPDLVATRLRAFPILLAFVLVLIFLSERIASEINASLTLTVALNCMIAVLLGGLLATTLVRFERARRQALADPESSNPVARPVWMSAIVGIAWAVLATAVISILTGYVAFGSFAIKQLNWTLVVLASAYLFSVLADDVFTTLLAAPRPSGDEPALELAQPRLREQAAVLLSGAARVLLAMLALLLLLAPFGAGPVELFQRLDQARGGIAIGEVVIRPARVAQAIAVLLLTLLAVRLFKSWLARRYLPTTQLDPGMQASASTLFGYMGIVLAVALTLSAVGIGLERIAWVASALSVGIGFGLQAVVQNFVSGLIMLAERPVKVGDWVALGGIEGDIVRVNVRATEIQMSDRSTVIVPNSEFITKTVRNVTHSNPLGVVTIKLPMPLVTDAEHVREVIMSAFADHPGILDNPAPNVFIDGIDANGNLMFNASASVSSPRAAYGVRSAILFDVLARLRKTNVDMYRPAAMVMQAPGQTPALSGQSAEPATSAGDTPAPLPAADQDLPDRKRRDPI